MRVLKLYLAPCPMAREILKHADHIGFRVKGDTVSHVFRVRKRGGKPQIKQFNGSRIVFNSTSQCVILETRKCIVRELLENSYLASFKVHEDYIVAVVAVSRGWFKRIESEPGGPCLIRVEEVKVSDLIMSKSEVEAALRLLQSGFFRYRRSSGLREIASRMGIPKSRLSYIVRRIAAKALVRVV